MRNLDAVTTIHKSRLLERVGALGPERTTAVDTALRFALGLDA